MVLPAFLAAAGPALAAAGQSLGPKQLQAMFGSTSTQRGSSTSSSGFDASQLPLFLQQLGQSDQASQSLAQLIERLGGQRTSALRRNLDQQLATVQGVGDQEISDINQRYNSRQGGVGQQLASRGLYNSTLAPGMSALVERERNSALGQARNRQQQFLSGVLGQRAQALDRPVADQVNALSQLGFQDYGLRTLLPKAIAGSTRGTTSQATKNRTPGLFSRLVK